MRRCRWTAAHGPISPSRAGDRDPRSRRNLSASSERGRLFRHNGLHIEVVFDRDHPIGRDDPAGIADVVLESALTTIVDLEDSIAAVDAEDKVAAYAQLARADAGRSRGHVRQGRPDDDPRARRRTARYTAPDGSELTLPGRSLLFVRNVGHLMTTPAVLLPDGIGGARRHSRRASSPA